MLPPSAHRLIVLAKIFVSSVPGIPVRASTIDPFSVRAERSPWVSIVWICRSSAVWSMKTPWVNEANVS